MTIEEPGSEFFTAGGTLPPDARSYVTRPTDEELFRHILAGEFCYVLTPRQMGKSSLMIRTAQRLQREGIRSAIVDLTVTGTVESEDQWYKGILTQIKRRLRVALDPVDWWEGRRDIPNVQKFVEFFEEALSQVKERIVIFMDEIDTTLKLSFRDDFFAGIRAIYNGRANNPDLKRITFVLLGVASPSDLIKDRNRTPFNIGQEILLKPFNREDAGMLETGLDEAYPKFGKQILDRVFYWTNGHPYLTQKLCQSLVEAQLKQYSSDDVDSLVSTLFTSDEASRETNLQFVRDNILSYPERRVILSLYKKLLRGSVVPDDKNSLPQNHLKLSGLARPEEGRLVASNRIYSSVFDQKWVNRYVKIDWRYPIIGVLSLLVIGFASVFYYDGVRLPNQAATLVNDVSIYYQDQRVIKSLADLSGLQPIILRNEYEYKAKDVFFNLLTTWDEQKALIEITPYDRANLSAEDYREVVTSLYTSLADVDESGRTTQALEVMHESLNVLEMQNDPIFEEIGFWLDARSNVSQGDLERALPFYNSAIEINDQNPATLFERARIYARLGNYELALQDYEQSIAIIPASNFEPTEIPTSPIALPPTPDLFATPTPTREPSATLTEGPAPATETPVLFTKTVQANSTESPAETVPASPNSTNTHVSATNTPIRPTSTHTGTPTQTATPTPTPDLRPIQPRFLTRGQRIAAVRNDIYQNENLLSTLLRANPGDYPYLVEIVPALTAAPSATIDLFATPTAGGFTALSETPSVSTGINLPTILGTPINSPQLLSFTELARWGIGGVNVVDWSPDGRVIALGTTSGIFLLDVQTKEMTSFIDTQFNVLELAFNPRDPEIAAGSPSGIVKTWSLETGKELQSFIYTAPDSNTITDNRTVSIIAYSPGSDGLIVCYKNGAINYFSPDQVTAIFAVENYPLVEDLAISSDGRTLYASNGTTDISVWDVSTLEIAAKLSNPIPINDLGLSNDDQRLLASNSGTSVYLWNVQSRQLVTSFSNLGGSATDAEFSYDDQYIVLGLDTGEIKIYETPAPADYTKIHLPLLSINAYNEPILSIGSAPDQLVIASGNHQEGLKLWDMQTGENLYTSDQSMAGVDEMYFSNNGNWLATSHADGLIRIWDVEQAVEAYPRIDGYLPKGAPFSPDNRFLTYIFSPGANKANLIRVLDLSSGEVVTELPGYVQNSFVQFSDDSRLLINGDQYSANIWNVDTWQQIDIRGGSTAGCGQYFGSQSELLAVIYQAGIQFTNDVATQKMCGTKPNGAVLKYFFHDENLLIFVLGDGNLWIGNSDSSDYPRGASSTIYPSSDDIFLAGHQESGWYAYVTGQEVNVENINNTSSGITIEGQDDYRYRVAFSPANELMALGSRYGSIHIWSMAPRQQASTSDANLVILEQWWSPPLADNFAATKLDLDWLSAHCSGESSSFNYEKLSIEGRIFSPDAPQPAGTIPLYSWYSCSRGDGYISTSWMGNIGDVRSPDYQFVRLEGYIYKSSGNGTIPLYSWWSPSREDNFASTTWTGNVGDTKTPDYTLYRVEGYIFPP